MASQPGEIITFQVGTYANFVGSHFFNLQDPLRNPEHANDFDWRVFWREGHTWQRKSALTPRVLMFDLKDNWTNSFIRTSAGRHDLKVLDGRPVPNAQSPLEIIEKDVSWDGKVQRVMVGHGGSESEEDSEPVPGASRKANMKNNVKLDQHDYGNCNWGDYTQWRLHSTEKFAFRIPNYMYNAESEELVSYGQGLDVYQRLEENVTDGIRQYAEDCDRLEGFHMLVDEYNGFTGIAGGILEHLGDDYDKKATLGLGLNRPFEGNTAGQTLKDYKIRLSNTSQLWSSFSRHARVFSSFGVCEDIFNLNPVARKFTGVIQDCTSPSISSAILAGALDSLTIPYRRHSRRFPLHEMSSLLNAFGHKMTMIGSALPIPLNQRTLFSTLNDDGLSTLTSLTPNISVDLDIALGNLFIVRGIPQEQVISKSESREFKHVDINNVTSCLELYCQESYPRSVHVVNNSSVPFKLSYPFPILHDREYLNSQASKKESTVSRGNCWQLPALASAHNTPAVGNLLEKMVRATGGGCDGSMMKMKTFFEPSSATCNSTAVEFEDFADCINDLSTLRDSYVME